MRYIIIIFISMLSSQDTQTDTSFESGGTKGSIGTVTINGQVYNQLSLRPEIPIGKLGVGLDIYLYFNDNGILYARGYVGSNSKWERAKASILEDIDAIKEINTDNIETFKERVLKLNTLLQKDGLKRNLKLKTDPEHNTVTITGELTNASSKKWKAIKDTFDSRYSGYPAIKSRVTDIENNLKLSIRGVSIGKTKYFTSTSGKKYMVGSDLGNGFRVLKIEVDKITLLFDGSEITIFYNDESENKVNTI